MIALMDLRTGNYIHPAMAGNDMEPDQGRYLRILSINLMEKQVTAKADHDATIHTLRNEIIYACDLNDLARITGGLSFGEHAILLQEGLVSILHENGSLLPLPHIRYVHQFQNLVRSLTGDEFPFNLE